MSTTTDRMPLSVATRLASTLAALFVPRCLRIEVAGSIRRKKPTIGDVELVCIPLPKLDLFGAPDPAGGTLLDPMLDSLCAEKKLERVKGGEKYRQYKLVKAGCNLDLFLCTPLTWAVNLTIRTGDSNFSHRLVTPKSQGGFCPDGYRFSGARLWKDGHPVDLAEEADLFAALGLPWVEPWNRNST